MLLCTPYKFAFLVLSLMAMLPDMFTSSRTHEVVLEPVVRAGMEAIKVTNFLVPVLLFLAFFVMLGCW